MCCSLYQLFFKIFPLKMSSLAEILCLAEAAGELDEPFPSKRRRYWVHPLNSSRESDMRFTTFFNEFKKYPEKFFDYYRMSILSFEELLEKVRPKITKEITHLRNPITAEERLTVTLRYHYHYACLSTKFKTNFKIHIECFSLF